MIADLARALPAALVAGVLPGYFWARLACTADGLAERLAYSAAVSMATVPAVALLVTQVLGIGVTLWVALATIAVVAGSGALACRRWGAAAGPAAPALPRPPVIRDVRALALILAALAVGLAAAIAGERVPGWLLLASLAALAIGAVLARRGAAPAADPGPADPALADPGPEEGRGRRLRAPALALILALTAVRGYTGVVWHDWPYVRGEDQFSHAVMTEQMLAHGSYAAYLVYPPGFATLSAVICRLSGLPPLALFPVLAPAFLLLTTMAAYALATRLWGWGYGLAAAALSGLVLVGPYVSFSGGLYPDMLSAFFLIVMTVAALITLYQAPGVRSGFLVAVIGAAVVLFHTVASLYLVLLLAPVAVIGLPYLLARRGAARRALARALALALAALGALSLVYAWHIYGLGKILGGSGGTSATIGLDVGSQPVLRAGALLYWVGSPVIWLGVFGFAVLAVSARYLKEPGQVLSALTVLGWGVMMYAGSRTATDGFPQRFERDVGGPLTILAALGLGLIATSLAALGRARSERARTGSAGTEGPGGTGPARRALPVLAAVTAALVVAVSGVQAVRNLAANWQPSREVLPRGVAQAGAWLGRHNTGGTIISTPDMNRGITNRAVLALGGYTGLQSYELARIRHPRSLPTAGRGPLLDSHEVLVNPAACRAGSILAADRVRYIVLYRPGNEANFAGFRADPARYRQVFENRSVVIYAPRPAVAGGCGPAGTTTSARSS